MIVIGLAIGAWHGFWVAYVGVPGFVTTGRHADLPWPRHRRRRRIHSGLRSDLPRHLQGITCRTSSDSGRLLQQRNHRGSRRHCARHLDAVAQAQQCHQERPSVQPMSFVVLSWSSPSRNRPPRDLPAGLLGNAHPRRHPDRDAHHRRAHRRVPVRTEPHCSTVNVYASAATARRPSFPASTPRRPISRSS